MSDMSVKLERKVSIPPDLANEEGPIGSIIDTARTVSASHSHAAVVLAERARTLLRNACPSYQPNQASKAGLMCLSGQDGDPFRGTVCCTEGCLVSQVQQKDNAFIYVGKRAVEDKLVDVIFAEIKDNDGNQDPKPEERSAAD